MSTNENIIIWVIVVIITISISMLVQKILLGPIMTREEHLEQKVKELTRQIESLQYTITMLSNRIALLEKENSRLKSVFLTATKKGVIKNEDFSYIALALEKLSSMEVSQLAYNHFRDIYNDFSGEQSLQARRLSLLEYAVNHDEIEDLKAGILELNPAAFG